MSLRRRLAVGAAAPTVATMVLLAAVVVSLACASGAHASLSLEEAAQRLSAPAGAQSSLQPSSASSSSSASKTTSQAPQAPQKPKQQKPAQQAQQPAQKAAQQAQKPAQQAQKPAQRPQKPSGKPQQGSNPDVASPPEVVEAAKQNSSTFNVVWWTTSGRCAYEPTVVDCNDYPACASDVLISSDTSEMEDANALMFNAFDMIVNPKPYPEKRIPGQKRVLFSMEPAGYYGAVLNNATVLKDFDMTMTYRMDSDVPVPYFPGSVEDLYLKRRDAPPAEFANYTRSKIFFMSSNCRPRSERLAFLKKLMEYIPVDSYGKCEHNIDFPEDYKELRNIGEQSKETTVAPVGRLYEYLAAYGYKFVLAFENSNCKDYVSEKLYRALTSGLVPVYFGAPNVKDFLPHPKAIFDVWSDWKDRPAELAKKLKELIDDDSEYQKMLNWKELRGNSPVKLRKVFNSAKASRWCRLCGRVRQWKAGKWKPAHPPQPDDTCPKDQYATWTEARIAAGVPNP